MFSAGIVGTCAIGVRLLGQEIPRHRSVHLFSTAQVLAEKANVSNSTSDTEHGKEQQQQQQHLERQQEFEQQQEAESKSETVPETQHAESETATPAARHAVVESKASAFGPRIGELDRKALNNFATDQAEDLARLNIGRAMRLLEGSSRFDFVPANQNWNGSKHEQGTMVASIPVVANARFELNKYGGYRDSTGAHYLLCERRPGSGWTTAGSEKLPLSSVPASWFSMTRMLLVRFPDRNIPGTVFKLHGGKYDETNMTFNVPLRFSKHSDVLDGWVAAETGASLSKVITDLSKETDGSIELFLSGTVDCAKARRDLESSSP